MSLTWSKIQCLSTQLQLKATLAGGQSFRWKPYKHSENNEPEWIGVMGNCLWLLKQDSTDLFYKVISELPYPKYSNAIVRLKIGQPKAVKNSKLLYEDTYYESLLKSYFRLDVDLESYYEKWALAHKHFKSEAGNFYAVRVLNQEPVENLFSFICSQNNNISRITTLVETLCTNYGAKICDFDGQSYYAFPEVSALSKPSVDAELRIAKFGYRAKFIQKCAEQILANGDLEWFAKLQKLEYKEAHTELVKLTGIGPKVADCICLMSLNHLQAIPVDTHVFQIAANHYLPSIDKKSKSVTAKIYAQIGDHFRDVYGEYAGWAQTVLFCADLAKLREGPNNEENSEGKSSNGPTNKKKKKN